MTTEPLELWLIDRIAATWNCPVYDSPPQEQTAPPYAVLERLPDVDDGNPAIKRSYEQWRYAIYGVFRLSDLVGASVGEGKRDKYQRLRDELHNATHFTWLSQMYLCHVRVVGYDPTVDLGLESDEVYTIRVEVSINV